MELAKFAIAVNCGKDEVMFFDCTVFGKQANTAMRYLSKGSKVGVSGRLKPESWTSKDGEKKSKISVIVNSFNMLDSRKQSDEPDPRDEQPADRDHPF
jgi:single-strand DNA-binding protein